MILEVLDVQVVPVLLWSLLIGHTIICVVGNNKQMLVNCLSYHISGVVVIMSRRSVSKAFRGYDTVLVGSTVYITPSILVNDSQPTILVYQHLYT